jgi:hypothetical protein
VLVADVKPLAVPTVYAAIGDWFAYLACFASFSLLALAASRERIIAGGLFATVLALAAPLTGQIGPAVAGDSLVWTFVLSASAGPLLWRVVRAYRA